MNIIHFVDTHMKSKKENTKRQYINRLKNFEAWLDGSGGSLENLTRADVQQYHDYLLAKGMKPATVHNHISAIRFYAKETNQFHAIANLDSVKPPKLHEISPETLTRNEQNKLLRDVERDGAIAGEDNLIGLRNIAIVNTLLYTGVRVSELCGLNRSDITLTDRSGQLAIKKGKSLSAVRVVPIPKDARYHLKRYLEARTNSIESVFLSQFRQRMSERSVERVIEKYGTHPHKLRHTYGRSLWSSGVDAATIAYLMGHSDINMSYRYGKPTLDEAADLVERAFLRKE